MRIVLTLLLAVSAVPAGAAWPDHAQRAPCEGADVDPWVAHLRDRVLRYDLLAKYAVQLFGAPIACEGAVTAEFEGSKFGVLRLGFEGNASFEVETQPPEASIATLTSPAGFAGEQAARGALQAYCDDVGVEIDWTDPEIRVDGADRIVTYRDPEDGLNASASLVYRDGALVELRFSLAL